MCCFFSSLLLLGPRLAILVGWLFPRGRLKIMFAFNSWIIPLIGWIFLPWTTLMYVIVFPVWGFDWIWIGMALLADLAGYAGGARSRNQVPGYTGS